VRASPRLLSLLSAFVAALAGAAAVLAAEPARGLYYELGVAQGARGHRVTGILQDRQGLLWFGTVGGLFLYDGSSFTHITPSEGYPSFSSSAVESLIEDRDGHIWIGMGIGGLARLEPRSRRLRLYGPEEGLSEAGGDGRVLALCEDAEGRLIAGTGDGMLYRSDLERNAFKPLLPPRRRAAIMTLLADSQGRIWAGTDGEGLLRSGGGGSFDEFRPRSGDASSLGSSRVASLFEDSLGFIWIGFGDGNVDLFSAQGFRHVRAPRGAAAGRFGAVRALAEDPEGRIWVGFDEGGIGRVDPASLAMVPPSGRAEPGVTALFRDRCGLLWAALSNGGVRAYNVRMAPFFERPSGPRGAAVGDVQALLEEGDGSLLVASRGAGLFAVRLSGQVEELALPGELRSADVSAMTRGGDGSLWLGCRGLGLARLRRDGSTAIYRRGGAEGFVPYSVSALCPSEDGGLWVGTMGGGLQRFDPRLESFSAVPGYGADGRSGRSVNCLALDSRGRLWIGYSEGGLAWLGPGSDRPTAFEAELDSGRPLSESFVTCVSEDRSGRLWAGTASDGLLRVDPDTGKVGQGAETGGETVGPMIYGLAEDRSGVLWIASSSGLSAYDRERCSCYLIGEEDGLSVGKLGPGSLSLSRAGILSVGGAEGLLRFDPLLIPRYAPSPGVAITRIQAAGGEEPLSWSEDGRSLVLGHDNRGLSFRIAVTDYTAPTRNRYAMKLEGLQSSWVSLGGTGSGYIAPLPPGSYMLRAKGANGNGVWNDYGASLSIVVEHPFWDTWWFRSLAACALAAALAMGIALRTRALRRRADLLSNLTRHIEAAREEERRRAAREAHDTIGQHLTILSFRAFWLASHQGSEEPERVAKVKEMQLTIAEAMAAVKSLATRLRPAALDLLGFSDALGWYVRDLPLPEGMRVEVRDEWEGEPIRGEAATALFRILQEMLGNVMRHSKASVAIVKVRREGDMAVLEVEDDGEGIPPGSADRADSFGLIGMRERCAAFGGSLEIGGEPGKGARVEARLRLASAPGAAGGAGRRKGRRRGC